ncbi:DUF397 domain-containing protein [Nocardia sp. CDC160]|uniref:DUF397 domain-containing protein n=1 Tax=Nocardia sp. CDC160 TaxID=3112166 RepID=UPI002DBD3838|nr:DUF397 domain-containing protein [Nocardia sp. CDC160]MEC3914421.1 DUF397 domain-containing protein [Nocardia sp. CDC160]
MINDLSGAQWFKSSRSANASECVEVAFIGNARSVGVRDSKDPAGPVLVFSGEQWDRFLESGIWR